METASDEEKKITAYKMSSSVDQDIAYVDYIAEEAQRFSRMFEPGYEPSFRPPSPPPRDGEEYNDDYDDYGDYDDYDDYMYEAYDDASASASAPSPAPSSQKKKEKKRRASQADKVTSKRSKAAASVALSRDDMKTWKFAPRRPNATRFRKNTVVGPVFITAVDRSDGDVYVFGRRFLDFRRSVPLGDVYRDDEGEYFHLFEDPVYGEGKKKIRPSTPPDCDGDVDAERERG